VIRGYRMIITLPEKMSNEKMNMLKALGAEIIRTPTEAAWDAPESHISVAARLQKQIPNSHILDQYKNPSNPLAHYEGTAEEILYQTDGKVDMVVVGAGTGGTISGLARKLKEKLPNVKVVGVDPIGSILAQPESLNVTAPPNLVEGIGYDFVPEVLDRSLVDEWIKTGDVDSFRMSRRLLAEEAMMCGGSSGSAMHAALQAAKQLGKGQRCVVILPDSTRNYMTKFLDDEWMVEKEIEPESYLSRGGLGVGVANHQWWESCGVVDLNLPSPITVPVSMSCAEAAEIMRMHDIDQLPTMEDGGVVGVLTSGNLTSKIASGTAKPSDPVETVMFTNFRQVPLTTQLANISHIFKKNSFCLVVTPQRMLHSAKQGLTEKKVVVGVCTYVDLLNFIMAGPPDASPVPSRRAARHAKNDPLVSPDTERRHAPDMNCSQLAWTFMKQKSPPFPVVDGKPGMPPMELK